MIAALLDYHYQYTAVVSFCVFLFCFRWVAPRFGVAASLLLACVSYSAIWVWVFVQNRYVTVPPYDQMALRYFAADSAAKTMLILTPLMVLSDSRQTMRLLGEIAAALFVSLSSFLALWEARGGCGALTCGGLIGNPSISMGFMACLLPLIVRSWRWQWPVLILAGAAIYVSKSSVAVGLLAAYACLWLAPWEKIRELGWRAILPPAIAGGGILAIARFSLGRELFNDSDRFMIWRFMFDRWRAPGNLVAGTGIGTYHVFSVNLQNIPGRAPVAQGYYWETMHNDPLQMLFECGIVGLALMLATYSSALLKVVRERDWAAAMSIVLFGLYMLMDPALHNPLPILFGAWLFVYALRREPTKEYQCEF